MDKFMYLLLAYCVGMAFGYMIGRERGFRAAGKVLCRPSVAPTASDFHDKD